jgi:uncharacterized membrane protein
MPELIAIAYTDETVAGQAAIELERSAEDLLIDPDAIGVVVCERDGKSQLMTSRHPDATAAWSSFWGIFFGVVMDDAEKSGIDSAFRHQVRGMLKPGTSVLFVAVGRVAPKQIFEALSHYDGRALTCALNTDGTADAELAPLS